MAKKPKTLEECLAWMHENSVAFSLYPQMRTGWYAIALNGDLLRTIQASTKKNDPAIVLRKLIAALRKATP